MAIGSKAKYTAEQKRKAQHIEAGYEKKGVSSAKAEEIAWATVNKQSGGGERSGSGKNKPEREKAAARRDSARRASETRHENAGPDSLEGRSKEYLLTQARKQNIVGRSKMNKADLILALQRAGQTLH